MNKHIKEMNPLIKCRHGLRYRIKKEISNYIGGEIKSIQVNIKNAHNDWYEEVYTEKLQTLKQIKNGLEILKILTKCIRVSIISYDDNDMSKTAYDYSLETDQLITEEFNILDNYCKSLGVCDE